MKGVTVVELIKRCIIKHSNLGDVVFDGFIGSGTTAVACIDTKRRFIGSEIDKYYFDVAKRRIEQHNSQISLFEEI